MDIKSFMELLNSNTKVKKITKAFNELKIDDRKSVLDSMDESVREEFINKIRQQAVNDFWTHEQELIRIIQ